MKIKSFFMFFSTCFRQPWPFAPRFIRLHIIVIFWLEKSERTNENKEWTRRGAKQSRSTERVKINFQLATFFRVRLDGRVLQPSRNNFLPSLYFFSSFRELNFLPYCSCLWNKLKGDFFLLVKILKKFLNLKSEKVKIINQKWSCMNRKVSEEWDIQCWKFSMKF